MPFAALHRIRDDFFGALPALPVALHFMRVRFIVHFGVEISFPFKPLLQVALPFFQEVGIYGALLIDRDELFQVAFRKLRSGYCHLHSRTFCHVQIERDRILCRIIFTPAHRRSCAQMPFLYKKFPDAVGPALQPGGRDFPPGPHLQPGKDFGIAIFGIVLEANGFETRARSGLYVDDNVHLVRLRMRQLFRPELRPVQALIPKRLLQPLQCFSDQAFPVSLPQSKLHRRGRRRVAGRGGESFDAHLIEKQILSRHEVQPDSALDGKRHRTQVGIIPRPVQRAHAFRDLSSVQPFPGFHRDSRGRFRENRSVFFDDADRYDFRSGIRGHRFRRFLGARQRSSRQERECGNASQPISPAQFHAPNRSDAG